MLNIEEYPCKYVETENGTACHMHLEDVELPKISVLTPYYRRKHFQTLMLRNWDCQEYPKNLMEWVIVDDSPKPEIGNKILSLPNVKYIHLPKKIPLGKKRNLLASVASHEILVHMDDDDWYDPRSFLARVKVLVLSGKKCTGCTKTLCYDLLGDQTFEAYDPDENGNPSTISEATLAYRKSWWKEQMYDNEANNGECLELIKGRHKDIVSIPYIFVVTQFSHGKNTIARYIDKSTKHTVQFMDNLPMMDSVFINNLKAEIISQFPEWKNALRFLKMHGGETNQKKWYKQLLGNKTLRENPMILEYYRRFKSGKKYDVVYYCGPGKYLNFTKTWDGGTPGLGGSEEAVVNLAENWAKNKMSVCVFNNVTKITTINGVIYKPWWMWLPLDRTKHTIFWRDPSHLDFLVNSENVYLDLHDIIDVGWITKERLYNATKIMCKSEFHRDSLGIDPTKTQVIPNGISCQLPWMDKRQYSIVCTSSPDRCLGSLLDASENLLEEFPHLVVYWAYGFKQGINMPMDEHEDPTIKTWVSNKKSRMEFLSNKYPNRFVDCGRLSHERIYRLLGQCNIFAYGTSFPEIDCISLTKALAMGCYPVVSHCGALGEKLYRLGIPGPVYGGNCVLNGSLDYDLSPENYKRWFGSLREELTKPIDYEYRSKLAKRVRGEYDWDFLANGWFT